MRSVAVLTLTGVLSQLVGFLFRILLTRQAGAEILGLYQLILPLYSVLASLTAVGLYTAVSNLSARYQALGNGRAIYQLRGVTLRLFFLLAVLPCALLLIFSDAASVYILGDARTRLGLLLLVPCLLLTGTENLHKHYFYGTGRVYPAAFTELLEQVLRALAILALLFLLRPSTPERAVGTIVLGMACSELLSALLQLLLFRLYLGPPQALGGAGMPRRTLVRTSLQIALPLGAAALLGNLLSSANAILIPRLLVQGGMEQSEAVSAYGVTFGMTIPMLLLPTAFLSALGLVLTPKLSEYAALGRREDIRRQVRRSVGASNLILIPALSLLSVLGGAIGAALYGEARVGDHLPLLALGVLFSCWESLFVWVLTGLNRQGAAAGISLVCDAFQLVLTCLLVGRMGLGGYALSFTLSTLLGAVLSFVLAARETGLQLPFFSWFAAPVLAACLGSSCGELMETVLLGGGLSPLAAASAAMVFGLLLYLAALQAMGVGQGKGGRTSRPGGASHSTPPPFS